MAKAKILLQLDSDQQASVFDAVVAVDAGVEHLLQYARVQPGDVRSLVHGAMFTRGPQDLPHTAIFVGGSDVTAGEAMLAEVQRSFFGPLSVSVMLDANGANTTAAAAVLAAERHIDPNGATALVLAATGPVGQRVARLLARAGARVLVASRDQRRAAGVCDAVRKVVSNPDMTPLEITSHDQLLQALRGANIVIAAGAAGVSLLPEKVRSSATDLKVAIDLNAVPPPGIEGVELRDKATERSGVICYGAVGVGGTKMKIHKASIQRLFESNDQILDAEQIFALGRELERGSS